MTTTQPAWQPLSASQAGLWLEHQLAPTSPAFTLCGATRLHGPIDPDALRTALDTIVRRHESLRTTFTLRRGTPGQQIHQQASADFHVIDLTDTTEPERTGAADRICRQEARRPFDLTRLPLWRTSLLQLTPHDHILLVSRHHLLSDGRAMAVFFGELDALYAAAANGRAPIVPAWPTQYRDFTQWQNHWLTTPAAHAQRDYWRTQLRGLPTAPILPADHPADHPAGQESGPIGTAMDCSPPPGLFRRVNQVALTHSVTPYTLLLAVFTLVLHKHSGATDLVVSSPVDARARVDFEAMIGFAVNSLPLRTTLRGDPAFETWLRQVQTTVLKAQSNKDVPLPVIAEDLRRSKNPAPSLSVEFAYQAFAPGPARTLDLPAHTRMVPTGAVRSDVALCIDQFGDQGAIRVEYRTDLYTELTIAQLLRSVVAVTEQVLSDPRQPVSAIVGIDAADQRTVLRDVNRTRRDHVPTSLAAWISRGNREPTAPAVITDPVGTAPGNVITHADLDVRCAALAAHLRALGVGPGSFVAVSLPRDIDLIVALWAIVQAGGAFVPLDPEAPAARRRWMLTDSGATVLITDQDNPEWACPGVTVISPTPPADTKPGHAGDPPSTDQPVYLMYTSGSTGRPKGVVVTQRGACNRLRWMVDQFAIDPNDRVVMKTPSTFDASVWEWAVPRLIGGCVALAGPHGHRDPRSLLRTIHSAGVTILQMVPSQLRNLLQEPELTAETTLRQVFCAGEVLPPALAEHWHHRTGVPLCNTYGPTETAIDVTAFRCEEHQGAGPIPIGRPIDNTRIYLLDHALQPVPYGAVGELYVAGAGLAQGYHGQPGLTADSFLPCPFGDPGERMYRTRDRARWLPGGILEYAGRVDRQLKIRGVRIEPGEIEALLSEQPGVTAAAVTLATTTAGEPILTAVAATGEPPPRIHQLHAALARRLPAAQLPGRILLLPTLPLTPNGKVDRPAVARIAAAPADIAAADTGTAPADGPLADPADLRLARVFEEVLGVAVTDDHSSFFSLGGHSLLAIRLLARLEEHLGLTVTPAEFFADPTIAGIRNASPHQPALIGPTSPDAPTDPSFAQQRLWFLDQNGAGAAYNVAEAFGLVGVVDVAAVRVAVVGVVGRQEVLRSRFVTRAGRPFVVVGGVDAAADVVEVVDLSGLPVELGEQQAVVVRRAVAQRPFDLGVSPLLRLVLIRLGSQRWQLVVVMPHIVSDAWSAGVLLGELSQRYRAAVRGVPAPVPELPVQYRDYAQWQRRQLTGSRFDDDLTYWRRQLADVPVLRLPTDRPHPAVRSGAGGLVSVVVPAPVLQGLQRLARGEAVTMFMVLMAGFCTLLHRYTGEDDLPVGTVMSQRHRPELDSVVGLFLNTLVLRVDAGRDPTFRELLGRVREVALAAYAHQDVPFDRLVDELQPVRDVRFTPLCQVMFVHQRSVGPSLELEGVRVEPLGADNGGAKFDLTVIATESEQGLALTAEFAVDVFDVVSVERLLGHLVCVLGAVVVSPGVRLSVVPLVSGVERAELVAGWSGAPVVGSPVVDVVRGFAASVAVHGSRVAVACGGVVVTYAELDVLSDRLAVWLRGLGVGPEVCVGLCVEPGVDLVVGIVGILKAGGAYVPLDPALPDARLRHALHTTRAPLLLTNDTPTRPHALPAHTRQLSLRDVPAPQRHHQSQPPDHLPDQRLAYVVLTSGSAGEPKTAGVDHRGLANLIGWYRTLGFTPDDKNLIIASPAFDLTQKNILTTLLTGGEIHLPAWHPADHQATAAAIERHRITVINCTPTAIYPLLDAVGERPHHHLKTLRYLILGGEPIAAARLTNWTRDPEFAATIINSYGPTECTDVVASHTINPATITNRTHIPIGRPVPLAAISVLDDNLQPVPLNVEGELCIHGAAVGRGYLGNPGRTAATFVPDPFADHPGARLYRTGDRGRRRADGRLDYLGRTDRQLKIRGYRIEPAEIERHLEHHPAIRRAVVTTHRNTVDDTRLLAHIVLRDGHTATPESLRPTSPRRCPNT